MWESKKLGKALLWIPTALVGLLATGIIFFAVSFLSAGSRPWEIISDILVHLRPLYLLIFITLIAWRWKIIGSISFMALGLYFLITMWWGKFPAVDCLMISVPLFLVGTMFLFDKLAIYYSAPEKEGRATFWAMLAFGLLYFLSEITLALVGGKFSPASYVISVIMVGIAFYYKYHREASVSKGK